MDREGQRHEKKPIIITGADVRNPPLFTGGKEAIVVLRNIKVFGCTGNGINADDGGSYDTPSRGMVFENITIEDIGPTGNRDGLKLSGRNDFVVRNCKLSGWGGSAIDMVGCYNGVIEKCQIVGKKGFS
ncbi:MAG: right-handed parallel beta-helix repeat-containing protein [Dehalococcoidia bacterium]|nr:right-handed parallel beta-helix repeat-containing protein [Dehalococcoidia bacterium]